MTTSKLYTVIHGHFYQPPRENPWLGSIEQQPSAYPYHDWNERIAASCYTPNTVSRVLDGNGRIDHILNNFLYLSFNVGPTLMHWLHQRLPRTAERIIDADRESLKLRDGHGNAIAQVYNHIIMPLATPAERELQIHWGIEDFRHWFGRDPEGMWLAETACNRETLDALIDAGIKFTILAPDQAMRMRPLKSGKKKESAWSDVSDGSIDTTRPYRHFRTSSNPKKQPDRYIDVFFFDRTLSTDISFAHLLTDAGKLGQRLLDAAGPRRHQQLINVATDGETFGWHEPFADMCLAYFFEHASRELGISPTNYGQYLEMFPPTGEVELKPGADGTGTSWSCIHGVDRWRTDCGCTTDSPLWWSQAWRRPLRDAFDILRDRLLTLYEEKLSDHCDDLNVMRERHIEVVLDHTPETAETFLDKHMKPNTPTGIRSMALALLESLRYSMLTYTSCGWFFGEVSRLEPVQNMKYALRAIDLAGPWLDEDLLKLVTDKLHEAKSNIPELGNGRKIFKNFVESARYDMPRIVASYAICLLTVGRANLSAPNFRVSEIDVRQLPDKYPSRVGLLKVYCRGTFREGLFAFHVTQFTARDIRCYIREVSDADEYERLLELLETSDKSSLPAIFGANYLSWKDMVPELSGQLMRTLFDRKLRDLRERFDQMFDDSKDLFEAYVAAGLELPYEVKGLVSFSLSRAFTDVIISHRGNWSREAFARAAEIQKSARKYGVQLDLRDVEPLITEDLLAEAQACREDLSAHRLANMYNILDVGNMLGLTLRRDLAENILLEVLEDQVMPDIDALDDVGTDFESYKSILGILDWAEKLNFSKRRFEERLQRFEKSLSGHAMPAGRQRDSSD